MAETTTAEFVAGRLSAAEAWIAREARNLQPATEDLVFAAFVGAAFVDGEPDDRELGAIRTACRLARVVVPDTPDRVNHILHSIGSNYTAVAVGAAEVAEADAEQFYESLLEVLYSDGPLSDEELAVVLVARAAVRLDLATAQGIESLVATRHREPENGYSKGDCVLRLLLNGAVADGPLLPVELSYIDYARHRLPFVDSSEPLDSLIQSLRTTATKSPKEVVELSASYLTRQERDAVFLHLLEVISASKHTSLSDNEEALIVAVMIEFGVSDDLFDKAFDIVKAKDC